MTSKPQADGELSTSLADGDDEDDVDAEGDTFAALLREVASAPDVRAERTLQPGVRVGEHEIVSIVGQGAFGTVYRAVHPVLGREVAIKVLGSAQAADPGTAQRFVEEARAIHRIRHPNIVDVFGFGELPSGQMYYAMELLEGKTLAFHAADHGAFEPALAIAVLAQVADALDAAHAHGVLHRDLKPDNIFVVGELGPTAGIKLLDFGVAKLLGEGSVMRTRSGMIMGTPAYMSPEQCGGESINEKSDIYALGVIAHELFTGERLFPGRSVRETMAQHMFEPPPRASHVRAGLDARVDEPLLAILNKDASKRPHSATAAVRSLEQALGGTLQHGVKRSTSRSRWWLAAAALLVVCAALLLLRERSKPASAVPAARSQQPLPRAAALPSVQPHNPSRSVEVPGAAPSPDRAPAPSAGPALERPSRLRSTTSVPANNVPAKKARSELEF